MGRVLVVAEKELAGEKIAEALGCVENRIDNITFWKNDDYIVVPARGHLLKVWLKGLNVRIDRIELPIFEYYWKVVDNRDDKARLETIKSLFDECDDLIVATDWDREGEVIGERIYSYCINDLENYHLPNRVYFASLTKRDIQNAFDNIRRMDEVLLAQGIARNIADAIIGLNLTKAITKVFKIDLDYRDIQIAISMGRVSNPVLSYIVDNTCTDLDLKASRGFEWTHGTIRVYIQTPIGCIEAPGEFKDYDYAELKEYSTKTEEWEQAEELPNTYKVQSELPFDPDYTLNLLEQMYLKQLITYPRTESTHAPEHVLQELESNLKLLGLLQSDNFSYRYCPHGTPEGDKLPILPTYIGLEHYINDKLSIAERIVMNYLITKVNRAFAPPIKIEKVVAVFEAGNMQYNYTWSVKVLNPEDAISSYNEEYREKIPLGKYPIIKIETENYKSKTIFGGSRFKHNKHNPKDIIDWMVINELGTDATRHEYINELKKCKYIDSELIPTTIGLKIARVIDYIKLGDAELTRQMERYIRNLDSLGKLQWFIDWLKDVTTELVQAIEGYDTDELKFTCPHGHEAILNARKDRTGQKNLWLYCPTCDKNYPI